MGRGGGDRLARPLLWQQQQQQQQQPFPLSLSRIRVSGARSCGLSIVTDRYDVPFFAFAVTGVLGDAATIFLIDRGAVGD